MSWSRRRFARTLGLGLPLVGTLPALAQQVVQRFTLVRLQHGPGANSRPTALRRLLWELGKRTSIEVAADDLALGPCDPKLPYHPLAFLSVDGALPPLEDCGKRALRSYLSLGGTLVLDAVQGGRGSAFEISARQLLEPLLDAPLKPISREHVLFKSFYLLDAAAGRTAACPDLDGVEIDGRIAAVVSHNDLAGAWARSNLGIWEHDVSPGGSRQRERAFHLGINLVMYALCIDYKEDQVHIPFILKKRRR